MGIIDISVAVIALAVVVLVIYLVKTLKSVQQSVEQVSHTVVHMQQRLDELSRESTELIKNTNLVTLDLQQKSKYLDALFQSVHDAGLAVQQVTTSVKQVSSSLATRVQQGVEKSKQSNPTQDRLAEVLKYTTLGIDLWQKWQASKSKHSEKTKQDSGKTEENFYSEAIAHEQQQR